MKPTHLTSVRLFHQVSVNLPIAAGVTGHWRSRPDLALTVAAKMKSLLRFAVLVIFAITSIATLDAHEGPPSEKRIIAFLHATVIQMDRERELLDQTVIVSN